MPSRWFVTLSGIAPEQVRLEALHAACTRWLDDGREGHQAQVKAYSLSPLRPLGAHVVLEVGLLTAEMEERLWAAVVPGRPVRFDQQRGRVASVPEMVESVPWEVLAEATSARSWTLRFATPTTFRRGNRFSPWPAPGSVLHGLADKWEVCSGGEPVRVARTHVDHVWVTDVEGASQAFEHNRLTVSGFVGRIRYECDDETTARNADRLLRLAAFSGTGTYTTRGFGVTRLEDTRTANPARRPAHKT